MRNTFYKIQFLQLLLVFWTYSGNLLGQTTKIDSLKALINDDRDTNQVNILNALAWEVKTIDPETARRYAYKADTLAIDLNFTKGEARALNIIGATYHLLSNYEKAIKFYEKAYSLYSESSNKKGMANALNNIGNSYYYKAEPDKALEYFIKALALYESINDNVSVSNCYLNIGNVHLQLGMYDKAIEYYEDALKIYHDNGDKVNEAQCLNNMGVVFRLNEDYDKAIIYYKKSQDIRIALNDKIGEAEVLLNLGDLYSHKKEKDLAISYFLESKKLYSETGEKKGQATCLNNIGTVYIENKEYDQALIYLQQSLVISKEIESYDLLKEAYYNISQVYAELRDFENAYDYFKLYSGAKDSILNQETTKQITEMRTKYESEKKEQENEILQKENTIKDLQMESQSARLTKQRTILISVIAAAMLLALAAWLVFTRFRLKQANARNELARKNIEAEHRLLRTQMNPHFIFNSLNSIQSFILQNDTGNADLYLAKFGRLMRYILENSRKASVSMNDEIATLKLYLELEKLRFNDKFDFNLTLADGISPENTMVPPMLVQPFIENAIIHGIGHKEGRGKIEINYSTSSNGLMCCTVDDDGVGREKAGQYKLQSGKDTHQSLGIQVTQERLDLLKKESGKNAHFSITDLKTGSSASAGTHVELFFPFDALFD